MYECPFLNKWFIPSPLWLKKSAEDVEGGCKSQNIQRRTAKYHLLQKTQPLWCGTHSTSGCLSGFAHKWVFNTHARMEETKRPWTSCAEWLATDTFRERINDCCQLCTHWWPYQPPMANPNPMVTQILVKPNGSQNKIKSGESGKENGKEELQEVWGRGP